MANCSINFFLQLLSITFCYQTMFFYIIPLPQSLRSKSKKELQTKFKFFSRNRTYIFLFFKPSDNICTKKH